MRVSGVVLGYQSRIGAGRAELGVPDAGLSCQEGLWGITVKFGLSGQAGWGAEVVLGCQYRISGVRDRFGMSGPNSGHRGWLCDSRTKFGVAGPNLGWQGFPSGYWGASEWQGRMWGLKVCLCCVKAEFRILGPASGCQGRIWGVRVWLWGVKAQFGMSGPALGC